MEVDDHVAAQQARLRAELPAAVAALEGTPADLRRRRDERLARIVAHARERSPWHRARLGDADPDVHDGDDLLARIPPMTKADLLEHWDGICTDRAFGRRDAEEQLRRVADGGPGHTPAGHQVVATGGTSGVRAVVAWDRDGFVDGVLGAVRSMAWMERTRALPPDPEPRRAQLGAVSAVHISAAVVRVFAAGGATTLLGPSRSPGEVAAVLAELRPTQVAGYPSLLHGVAKEVLAGRLAIAPTRVVSQAEPLLPEIRADLEAAFGPVVVNLYGASEALNLATSHPAHRGLHLNEDIDVVEPVDAGGAPVGRGRRSSKVLVTNLVNGLLPLLRYELTDEVELLEGTCGCGHPGRWIADVEGRLDDSFRYGDVVVHPHVLRSVLGREPAVAEYQVRQTPGGAEVEVLAVGPLDPDALAQALAAALRAAGVAGAGVGVSAGGRLARHGETAKLRRFVPLA